MKSFLNALAILIPVLAVSFATGQDPGQPVAGSADPYKRSMAGDREAMKWVIRQRLTHGHPDVSIGPDKFGDIPPEIDQIGLVIEILENRPPGETDNVVRAFGMSWLSQQKDPRAGQTLANYAMEPNGTYRDRFNAMRNLACGSHEEAARVLSTLAADSDPSIRGEVVDACVGWPDPMAEEILKKLTNDSDRSVRVTAAHNLDYWREHTAPRISKEKPAEPSTPQGAKVSSAPGGTSKTPAVKPPLHPSGPTRPRLSEDTTASSASAWPYYGVAFLLLLIAIVGGVVFVRKMARS